MARYLAVAAATVRYQARRGCSVHARPKRPLGFCFAPQRIHPDAATTGGFLRIARALPAPTIAGGRRPPTPMGQQCTAAPRTTTRSLLGPIRDHFAAAKRF